MILVNPDKTLVFSIFVQPMGKLSISNL